MFKIAVVDDEPKILNGIVCMLQDILAKEAEVTGYLSAAQFLNNADKIDILITDICMPEMDGITMGNLIKERCPDSKIIIISGHEDFGYARRAIRLQVTEYLLKPVDRENLEKIICAALKDIRKEQQNLNPKKLLFYRIMSQNNSESKELLKSYYRHSDKKYYICILECGRGPNNRIDFDLEEWTFKNMQEVFRDFEIVHLLESRMGVIIFESHYPNMNVFNQMAEELLKSGFILTIGISSISQDMNCLHERYQQAVIAAKQELYTQKEGIYIYQTTRKVEIDLEKLVLKMLNSLVNLDSHMFMSLFSQLFDEIKQCQPSIYELKSILDKITGDIKYLLEKVDVVSKKYDEMERKIILVDQYRTIASVEQDLFDFLHIILEEVNQIKTLRVEQSLQLSIDYIHKNYQNDISLDEVAGKVHLNPSYFSSYFKKHTGYNFVDYITRKRLEEAKKYLQIPDYRISDIANQVGFKEARYFAKIFKNNVGVTPSQYREISAKMKNNG